MRQIEYSKTRLVSRHGGTLPVLLTCSHGGDEVPPGVPADGLATRLPAPRARPRPAHPRSRQALPSACLTSQARRPPSSSPSTTANTSMPTARRHARSSPCRSRMHGACMTNITIRSAYSLRTSALRTAGSGSCSTSTAPAASMRPLRLYPGRSAVDGALPQGRGGRREQPRQSRGDLGHA
jgi:hypothetical protein